MINLRMRASHGFSFVLAAQWSCVSLAFLHIPKHWRVFLYPEGAALVRHLYHFSDVSHLPMQSERVTASSILEMGSFKQLCLATEGMQATSEQGLRRHLTNVRPQDLHEWHSSAGVPQH